MRSTVAPEPDDAPSIHTRTHITLPDGAKGCTALTRVMRAAGVLPQASVAGVTMGWHGGRSSYAYTGGIEVVLSALVYANILEEHPAVADLDLIDRTIREPDERWPDPRPSRERFFSREGDLWVLAVVDFEGVPAIIVTVFSTERPHA